MLNDYTHSVIFTGTIFGAGQAALQMVISGGGLPRETSRLKYNNCQISYIKYCPHIYPQGTKPCDLDSQMTSSHTISLYVIRNGMFEWS